MAAILLVATYCGAEFSLQFGSLPTIWPADGIMLAILLRNHTWTWPAYILAGLAGNMSAMYMLGYHTGVTFEFPLAAFAEIIFIALLLRPHISTVQDLSRPGGLLRFMFLAGGAAPLLVACLNASILHFRHMPGEPAFFAADFLSHSLGLMTVTPVALSIRRSGFVNLIVTRKIWLAAAAAAVLLSSTTIVFAQSRYPLLFMVYPPLVLVVCCFRLPGGALGIFVVTLISLGFTLAGHGPAALIHTRTPLERIILIQLFAGEASILVLALGAVLGDLDRAREQLSIAKEALALLVVTDSLTGLANRRRLDEVLEQECRRAVRNQTCLSLLMIDVDNFKAYNDFYGHPAGDDCLRAVSSRIAKFSTRPGDLTARYGGEELVILLADTGPAAAAAKAERIRLAVESMALTHAGNAEHGSVVTVSIGISTYVPMISMADPYALLSRADEMLYEAKRTGKNKSVSNGTPILPATASFMKENRL